MIEKHSNNDNGNFEIKLSDKIAYVDDDGFGYEGLEKDYQFKIGGKNIYVFDNHHKAIFYLFKEFQKNKKVLDLLHIDAHRDDAIFRYEYPEKITEKNIQKIYQEARVSDYLDLLQKTKLIGKIFNITQSGEFENMDIPESDFILNLDIDIFGPDGEVVDLELKIKRIIEA